MKHLTVDEIIDFVSFDAVNEKTLSLASTVNAHIVECDDCRKKVEAFQTVFDEFVRLEREGEFKRAAANGAPAQEQMDRSM